MTATVPATGGEERGIMFAFPVIFMWLLALAYVIQENQNPIGIGVPMDKGGKTTNSGKEAYATTDAGWFAQHLGIYGIFSIVAPYLHVFVIFMVPLHVHATAHIATQNMWTIAEVPLTVPLPLSSLPLVYTMLVAYVVQLQCDIPFWTAAPHRAAQLVLLYLVASCMHGYPHSSSNQADAYTTAVVGVATWCSMMYATYQHGQSRGETTAADADSNSLARV